MAKRKTLAKPAIQITIPSFTLDIDLADCTYDMDCEISGAVADAVSNAVRAAGFKAMLAKAVNKELETLDFSKLAKKALAKSAINALGGK